MVGGEGILATQFQAWRTLESQHGLASHIFRGAVKGSTIGTVSNKARGCPVIICTNLITASEKNRFR